MGPNVIYTPRNEFQQHQISLNNPTQHLAHQQPYIDPSILCYPDISCTSSSLLNTNEKMHPKQQRKDAGNQNSDTTTENMLFG